MARDTTFKNAAAEAWAASDKSREAAQRVVREHFGPGFSGGMDELMAYADSEDDGLSAMDMEVAALAAARQLAGAGVGAAHRHCSARATLEEAR